MDQLHIFLIIYHVKVSYLLLFVCSDFKSDRKRLIMLFQLKKPMYLTFLDENLNDVDFEYYADNKSLAIILGQPDDITAVVTVNLSDDQMDLLENSKTGDQISKKEDLIGMRFFKDADGKSSSVDQFISEGVNNGWFKQLDVIGFSGFNEYNAYEILPEFINQLQ